MLCEHITKTKYTKGKDVGAIFLNSVALASLKKCGNSFLTDVAWTVSQLSITDIIFKEIVSEHFSVAVLTKKAYKFSWTTMKEMHLGMSVVK